ncbi:hypothetical protein ACWD4N_44865 [Streptomyces sp. NPDC002586]
MSSALEDALRYRIGMSQCGFPFDCLLCGVPFEHDQMPQIWGRCADGRESVICTDCVDARVPDSVRALHVAAMLCEAAERCSGYPGLLELAEASFTAAEMLDLADARFREAEQAAKSLLIPGDPPSGLVSD